MFKLEETPEEREYLVKFNFITENDFDVYFSPHKKKLANGYIRPVRFDFSPDFIEKIERWEEHIGFKGNANFLTNLLITHFIGSYVTFQKEELKLDPDLFWNKNEYKKEFVRRELLKLNNIIQKEVEKINQQHFDDIYFNRFMRGVVYLDSIYDNSGETRHCVDKLRRQADKLQMENQVYEDDESEFEFIMAKREYDLAVLKMQIKHVEGELSMLVGENKHHSLYYTLLDKKRLELEKNVSES